MVNAMENKPSAEERISAVVGLWEGVVSGWGKRGELSFRACGREIGHLHGGIAAHFVFERSLWRMLLAADRITEHPIFPGREGPAERRIECDADIWEVIALMRLNYDVAVAREGSGRRSHLPGAAPHTGADLSILPAW
jgi:Luciferase